MNVLTARRIIRTDATVEFLSGPVTIREAEAAIKADFLDVVNLPHGMVMILDDLGHAKELPINHGATFLYHSVCRPGVEWEIRGDVVIVPDADFEVANEDQ